ncbi:MAG: 50S ribosomal protein L15 [Calditrichaeota bacterium]|nr:MAG: 50S ribosomal protein L15 [Calditrichota bacterium]MBL1205005.1 50S ribosomal protein L15 [Calditrichota bacterium]NOG44835.1 50S ribosomal protein L15 [Calditrichota bacterium]
MDLSSLKPNKGSTKKNKRRGRGEGSGLGVTAGRGHKGYGSRGGSKKRAWFEGGQMPLQRRLPKFGFTNINKVTFQVINVSDLQEIDVKKEITPETLYELKMIRKKTVPVKLLGTGELDKKVDIKVDAVSKSAREKVEKAGGTVTLS